MRHFLALCAAAFIAASCFALPARADDSEKSGIDWDRARALFERQQKGEKLSADEQAYVEKAQKIRQNGDPSAVSRSRGEQPPQPGQGRMSEQDIARVRELYQKMKNGEKLSPEEQAFMDKVKAGGFRGQGDRPIDWDKAKAIFQRQQNGEKLSPEDEAYLEKAKASGGPGGRGRGEGGQNARPDASGIDWEKAKALYQREQNGEKLSAEDQAYLDKAKASRNGGQNNGQDAPTPQNLPPGIDWDRARKLHQQEQNGEKLSAEDQAFLEKAKAALQGGHRPNGNRNNGNGDRTPPPAPPPAKASLDLTPLTDLPAGEKYKDQDGGLYGNGQNTPPPALLKLAQAATAQIKPLDASGNPSPDGKIVLMSIGMSNTTMEFSAFKKLADADSRKADNVVIVDAAQGGRDAPAWLNPQTWAVAEQRITHQGVTDKQVQAIWIKQAIAGPARHGEFPKHADDLKSDIEQILLQAKKNYPNLKLAYLSSRIYAGYAGTGLNPEPYAYEGAFSMRWVIQDQMKSNSPINADPSQGEVKAPLVLWGPYLWANGEKGRKTDSLTYMREDLGGDGTHPSASGTKKVADLLLKFFTTDETAKPWFVKK